MRWLAVVVVCAVLAATASAASGPPPWHRTESRADCAAFDLFRRPFFGELHVHTSYSADAYIFGSKFVTPTQMYAFARGETTLFLSDDDENATRPAHIDRPLDFAADTDHAEFFGEVRLCDTSGSPVYDIHQCQILRQAENPPDGQAVPTVFWLTPTASRNPQPNADICTTPGVDCAASAVSVWQDVQGAAEEFYDRTAACVFTTFVGYEYTASVGNASTPDALGRHLHRNVIFRNEHVPARAASYVQTAAGGIPQGLWSAVEDECLNAGTGCEAVIIPHNSNLSGGEQFFDPADATEALRRQTLEPLAEIHQIKGNSECRFDRLAGMGADTADELCTFEQVDGAQEGLAGGPISIDKYPARNMIRNALKDGLAFEDTLGVNPFKFGFTGSTDNHDGTAGNVSETGWPGFQGNNDSSPARQIGDHVRANPGGLTVAWAEENSRDAIFAALKRRETYATSGTRPAVRFFGGDLAGVACGSTTMVRDAYASGTPMGGDLGDVRGTRSPRFLVWATKDPGTEAAPGTDLQRIQIVKGWTDASGKTHERVFDVAGNAQNGADVDPATCAPRGAGASELCTVWQDPTFKRRERAFYYARVLENPTCRWSTRVCKDAGVDPFSASCAAQATQAGAAFADCCRGPANDAFLDPVVQERAWTSPIWYRPDAIARLGAAVRFGPRPGTDRLALRIALSGVPAGFDPAHQPLSVHVSDDDDIFTADLPAGALKRRGSRFVLPRPTGGLAHAVLTVHGKHAASLSLATSALDLSHADRTEHVVVVSLASGTYRATHARLWVVKGNRLVPGGR